MVNTTLTVLAKKSDCVIYSCLNDALKDIETTNIFSIEELLKHFDISVNYSELTDNIDGFSIPSIRTVFIKQSYANTIAADYPLAHELTHCLVDDEACPLINDSFTYDSKVENNADVGALYLLARQYGNINDVDYKDIAPYILLNRYSISNKHYLQSEIALRKLCKIRA